MLKTYRICNSTVGFSKYEFNNKLLSGVALLRITSSVTWIRPYICVCVCVTLFLISISSNLGHLVLILY